MTKKKAVGLVSCCFILIVTIALIIISRGRVSHAGEEKAFLIQRSDCIYTSKTHAYEEHILRYFFVSNNPDSIIFIEKGIKKCMLTSNDTEMYCTIKNKNYDVSTIKSDGEQWYVKPIEIGVFTEISDGEFNDCVLSILYDNGARADMKAGNISVLHDEEEYDNENISDLLIGSYAGTEHDYDTLGMYLGMKSSQDIEIVEISTTHQDYISRMDRTIVLKENCEEFDESNVLVNYPEADLEHTSNIMNKTIKIKSQKGYVLIIPFESKFERPLGYYAMKIKYKDSSGEIKEKYYNFGEVFGMLSLTEDILNQMKKEADKNVIRNV